MKISVFLDLLFFMEKKSLQIILKDNQSKEEILRSRYDKKSNQAYIIAEVINHNGKLKNCFKLIKEAAKAGVDAVKFQNWKAEDFISDKKQKFKYKSKGKIISEPFYDLCKRNELQENWLKKLNDYCKKVKGRFYVYTYYRKGIDELAKLKTKYIKNGSDYLTNTKLIKYMAKKFKNLIISIYGL